jgi:hypothetical protein
MVAYGYSSAENLLAIAHEADSTLFVRLRRLIKTSQHLGGTAALADEL